MKWTHNGTKYKTIKIDWFEYIEEPHDFLFTGVMVYSTKWIDAIISEDWFMIKDE